MIKNKKDIKKGVVKKIVLVFTLLFAGFHLFATFLWIAPASEARNVFPDDSLKNYIQPMFHQGWSVFAPNPINSDYYMDVRAVIIKEDGTEEITEWVRATDVEIDHESYGMFSPRSIRLGLKTATNLNDSWDKLSNEQKEIVGKDYYDVNEYSILTKELQNVENGSSVNNYIKADATATAYSTQIAMAVWGEDNVVKVQYRASEHEIIPFSDRNKPGVERQEMDSAITGWRGLLVRPHQDSEKFAEYFCASDKVECVK